MEIIDQGKNSMKPELLTNKYAANTTPDEKNVRSLMGDN
jgi:hypothetical protein